MNKNNTSENSLMLSDWRNDPITIAGASVTATLLLTIAIVTQIVIPTQTAKIELEKLKANDAFANASRNLEAEKNKTKTLSNTIMKLEKDNELKSNQISMLNKKIYSISSKLIFNYGNPYPKDFSTIHIGDSINLVYENYKKEDIKTNTEQPNIIVVKPNNSPFDEISYSFNKNDKEKKIIHMSFSLDLNGNFEDDYLKNKIIESLGQPIEHPEKDYYRWRDINSYSIYLLHNTYMIMSSTIAPALWPSE